MVRSSRGQRGLFRARPPKGLRMPDSPNVLLYGRDRYLIESRCLVLRKSGFKVVTALEPGDFETAEGSSLPDLVILCHTLSQEECRVALALSRMHWPAAKRLSLYSGSRGCSDRRLSEVLDASDGPAKLIATARQLVSNRVLSDAQPH